MAAVRAHSPSADHPATRLGPKRSASDPPSVGPNTLGANLARMYRAGASGRCVRSNSRTPSATTVSQSPYVEIPAATSRRADRSALGSVPAACGKKRATSIGMSTPGSGGGKQSATPRAETHGVAPNGFQKPRASPRVKGWGISPRLRRPPFPPPWIPPAPRSSSYRSGKVGFDRVRRSRSLRSRRLG